MKIAITKDVFGNFAIFARYHGGTEWYMTVSTKDVAIRESAQLNEYHKKSVRDNLDYFFTNGFITRDEYNARTAKLSKPA